MKPSWFWFSAALLAAGIPWWVAPYNRFTFSHPVSLIGFLVFVVIAAWAGGWAPFGVGRATFMTGSAVPSAVMARVVVDGAKDPTSHNLWPFEVVMAAAFGFGLAFSCALAGRLLRRVLGPE